MKKTSKILSLLVALCMAVTMLSGLTVFAADPFELVSYDADADFITLDFNQAIDTTNSVIVLKKGDAFVPFTLAKNLHHSNVQTKASTRHTYQVIPTGGVEVGEEYKITLWDVKSSDGASTLTQTAMTFVVEELANSADFQNIDAYKWTTDADFEKSDDDTKLYVNDFKTPSTNNMGGFIHAGALVGQDTTEEHFLPKTSDTDGSANWTETDYTFKATIKTDERCQRSALYLGIARNLTGINATSANSTNITGIGLLGYTSQGANVQNPNIYFFNGAHNSGSAVDNLAGNDRVSTKIDMIAGVELKVSSKNGVVRAFINGKKAADFAGTVAAGHPFVSYRPVAAGKDAEGVAYTASNIELSNMQVTQSLFEVVEELDTPEGYVPPTPEEPEPEEPVVPEVPEEEEYPELITAWDADLDVFTIDFAEAVQAFDATITQAGTLIPATVSSANYNTKTLETRYTWMVKPADGFVANAPYTVTISNVKNTAGTKKITTWSKTFKVEVLAEGLNLEEGTTHAVLQSSSNATFTNPAGSDDLVITANAKTDGVDSDKLHVFKALDGEEEYEGDYTVKVTYKNLTNAQYIQTGVGYTRTNNTSYGWDHNSMRGAFAYYGGNNTNDAAYGRLFWNNTGTNANNTNNNFATLNINGTNYQGGIDVELKLAVKDDFAQVYIQGKKISDAAIHEGITGRPQIILNIRGIVADTTASVTLADFVATRAVAITTEVDTFAPAEPTLTGAFTDSTVSISTVVTNNTIASKTIFAMCALYDATGAMKNVVIAPVTTAATGDTTVNFAGVETNGATYAKIFIWDTAAALNPYFPAIIVE